MEEEKRIKDLVRKLEEKHEISSNKKSVDLDEAVLKKYSDRFKKLTGEATAYSPTNDPMMGYGRTVNSIVDNNTFEPTTNKSFQNKVNAMNGFSNPSLTPKEGFEIAIKRTLESGAPVNNIGLYDEVNWNLQNMGFEAKSAIDIKNAINNIIKYSELKS